MFERIIGDLNKALDDLRTKRVKCEELMEKVQDKERKAKLSIQYDIICHAIDRVALCLDILSYRVSVKISDDWSEVRFPLVKEKTGCTAESAAADLHEAALGMPVAKVIETWRSEGMPLVHLGPGESCSDLEKLLSHPDVPEKHLRAIRHWLDGVSTKKSGQEKLAL